MDALNWLYIGIGLIIMELVTPGFILLFFGVAAFLVALVKTFFPGEYIAAELVGFGVLSLALILFLRKYVKSVFAGAVDKSSGLPDQYVGKNAVAESLRMIAA